MRGKLSKHGHCYLFSEVTVNTSHFSECPTRKNPADTLAGYRKSPPLYLVMNLEKNHPQFDDFIWVICLQLSSCFLLLPVQPTIMIQKSARRDTRSVLHMVRCIEVLYLR